MSKLYSVYHEKVSTADNMQSVSSSAVAQALAGLSSLPFGDLPQNANNVTQPYNQVHFMGGFVQPSTLSNYPSATDWSSAGGLCSYFLITYVAPEILSRVSQFCIMNYYNGTWIYRIWTRRRVDYTWFGWQQIL